MSLSHRIRLRRIVHTIEAESEEPKELSFVIGEVVEVFGCDPGPRSFHGGLDVVAHLPIVDADTFGVVAGGHFLEENREVKRLFKEQTGIAF